MLYLSPTYFFCLYTANEHRPLKPVTCKQILFGSFEEIEGAGIEKVFMDKDGMKIVDCHIVGQITGIFVHKQWVVLKIDDSTTTIDVKLWIDDDNGKMKQTFKFRISTICI